MLEKPNISDELIISRLEAEYELRVREVTFLPLGADEGTAVYRLVTDDRRAFFLKLRKGFEEITVAVPLFLRSQGIQEILAPIESNSGHGWADFGEYKIILYPFLEGKDGFERELSDHHRQRLGSALKRVHTAHLPPELRKDIPRNTFSPHWHAVLRNFQPRVEDGIFPEPTAAKLASFMQAKRAEIDRILDRVEELAAELQTRSLEFVTCHSDLHGGNILIGENDELYIVDWDNPILAPKERDLMFIGGGIDKIWKSEREEAVFYQGYGKTEIDLTALAYYRYERIIEDLAVICEQLLTTDEGGADRPRSFGWFVSNFEPGSTIEIARTSDKLLGI